MDYKVDGLTYDAGSNILTMRQRGSKIGANATIDSLTYQYFANSNQLQKVADGINDNSPLGDFKDTALATDDYLYDVNGNITKDNNRHMHTTANGNGAVYNVLDKPDSLVMAGKATIYYYHDASGGKLRKKVNDYTSGSLVVKDYLFINGFVYLNDTLQYVLQEEGRIRYARKKNSTTGAIYYAFEYEYFIRDHLGNVRTVLTEGRDTSTYAATMESADSVVVRALFSNVYDPVNTVVSKPSGFNTDGANQKVSKLNGNGNKTGPSLVLKVMAGDKVQISTYAFYNTAVQPPPGGIDLTSEILSLLSTGVVNNSGGKITNATGVSTAVNPGVTNFLTNNRPYDNAKPKAYLNWILFDNQFNYFASNSGVKQAQPGANKQALVAPLQTIAKNGYLYIYLSNESQQDVYFDDLNVKHYTGPLVQEQSYYPFGLQMAGISDKALNKISSQNKFNGGVELEEEYGINQYSTFFRRYDPQLGRFSGVDIRSEEYNAFSSYQFALNNPINFNDPFGDKLTDPVAVITALMGSKYGGQWSKKNGNVTDFNSDEEVFGMGASLMTINGLWGQGDFASSFGAAQDAYYKLGGTDPNIRLMIEPIILTGRISNNQWHTTTSEADIDRQLRDRGYTVYTERTWVDTYDDITGWGSTMTTAYQFRIYGAEKGPGFLNFLPGNKGWSVNNSGIYKSLSSASPSTLNTIKNFEKVGKGLFVVTAVISGTQLIDNVMEGDYKGAAQNGLDITMAAIGTFGGPVGAVVSTAYFVGQFFDWW